jgi:hypothetical protein
MLTPGFYHRLYIFWCPEACVRTHGSKTFDKPPFAGVEPMSNKPTGAGTNDGDVDETVDQRERERQSDDREHALDAREAQIEAREASRAERLDDSRGIRADADVRDKQADDRDWDASKRDMAANLKSWLHQDDKDGEALADREAASQNRNDSKGDRISSAIDRGLLTEDDDPRDGDATAIADC